jgi:hypothetical protein
LTRNSAEGAIAFALWRSYEESLPDTPWRMAKVIVAILKKEGYLADH